MIMKILYLIDSKKYNYHKRLADDFISVTGGNVIDTAGADPGKQYYDIAEEDPDVVITFDLAGHEFRTGNDTLSLNNIYTRFAHILFHRSSHYGRELKARQNLSMFTFIPSGEDAGICRRDLPEVPNIDNFVNISYKPESDSEQKENLANIALWWSDFKRKAML
ncbi:MAG: hypothetical protein K6E49_00355 [Lachnospiraceae bacterium]|nr:hypothetical protein [Lachnospiraceae bacterium]